MLDNLGSRFQEIFKKVRGHGKLSESNIKDALKEVKMSLLEADVNYKVVKDFTAKIQEKAIGTDVLKGINPGQQFIKIVNDELVELLGGTNARLTKGVRNPTVLMLAGLQGAGKTTFAAKLGNYLKKQGEKVLMVGADVYRPAAIKQLQVLGEQTGIEVYSEENHQDAVGICERGLAKAKELGSTYMIIDTAGRLHIDEKLMDELKEIKRLTRPQEILLVVDAMIGQDAVNLAESFNNVLNIDGVVLTKLDGDTRGGAALSIKAVVGKPIKFVGVGEKIDDIELFHPERLVSRILGMGDVVSLVEKAQSAIDEEDAKSLEEKIRTQKFDLDDFLKQLQNIKKLGSLGSILKMIPGMGQIGDLAPAEKEMKKVEAIIQSMTKEERKKPEILKASRKQRIAKGSGTEVADINRLLKQFEQMKAMMKMFSGGKMPSLPSFGGFKGGKGGKFPF
ncbi:signal recognition particle protein [Fusobacterium mortiferum]|jgi:signal recognition particle subunit SRP54|uniref:Signal recognition particle protein n=1 Tax=Fusobacterium mortiferum TaxID=850 RepID=A0A414Q084_FUSMR|nr:signal recognition particle protein [Fusobacterium mortiferum]MCF2626582.1 signal recognition particle protein [Fusobacterium mortiferum]MCI6381774.1 signal recognition particle protein [Fusobacterium mortiferum]MCI7188993.1 signal recognition particle protein [Fusobacterium mortiferum]MDY2800888.1 signal recognition particle protein [Fusobacterium mortiferum]MDY4802404.1 signal recognition particle protein [Fusobacterium mortiferum]